MKDHNVAEEKEGFGWDGTSADYWNKRAEKEYVYRKEKFYTITPIPYYYERRKLILKKIRNLIYQKNLSSVCDFGCGDGEYIRKLNEKGLSFYGIDASATMIALSKQNCNFENVKFEVSENGIRGELLFDMVYSSAIWAHIENKTVLELFHNIYCHLSSGGYFVLCEQTAPFRYGGQNYLRRTCLEYKEMLEEAGFKVIEITVIDFWLHRILVEKHLVKKLCKRKRYRGYMSDQIRIQLNKNKAYRAVSYICTMLSVPKVYRGMDKRGNAKNRWGYCFCVAVKQNE